MFHKTKLGEMYPEIYQNMRKADHDLTSRTMEVLSKKGNEKLLEAAKIHILNSIHLDEILGLNSRQSGDVDKFMTAYGIEPDGVFMDEKTLAKLFGPKFSKMLTEITEVRAGKASKEDLKKFISSNMTIDYENNRINFKQEFPNDNPPPDMLETEYPLWDWHARLQARLALLVSAWKCSSNSKRFAYWMGSLPLFLARKVFPAQRTLPSAAAAVSGSTR